MIKVRSAIIDQTRSAQSAAGLHALVREAIRLEFSTIPPYLTAMLSLQPGYNREIWETLHAIVVDEMLHMAITCNLLNALDGRPQIDDPAFVPQYPGPLPMSIGSGLKVGLEAFSPDLARRVFMAIEQPAKPIELSVADGFLDETFGTIGEFYAVLSAKVQELGDGIFVGDQTRQVVATKWFPEARLFPITNVASATRALSLIALEGEGSEISPVDPDGDYAHYYRFEELARLRRIARDDSVPEGFSFSGAAIPFDEQRVFRLTPNQRLSDLDIESQAGRRAQQCAFVFTKLLNALQRSFDGDPGYFDTAMSVMFELKLAAQILVSLPAVQGGVVTGLNAGPTFEYLRVPR